MSSSFKSPDEADTTIKLPKHMGQNFKWEDHVNSVQLLKRIAINCEDVETFNSFASGKIFRDAPRFTLKPILFNVSEPILRDLCAFHMSDIPYVISSIRPKYECPNDHNATYTFELSKTNSQELIDHTQMCVECGEAMELIAMLSPRDYFKYLSGFKP